MEMTREVTERLQKRQERLRKRQEGPADPRFRQQRLRKLSLRQRSRSPLSESQQRRDDRLSRRRERERKGWRVRWQKRVTYTRFFFSAISIFLPYIRSCNVCQPCAMDLSATDSSAMAWRSTQQRRIAAESTEEREARLQQLRILPNRNNHQDLLINCHSKYIPILLVLIDVFHYAIIEAFVMLFH